MRVWTILLALGSAALLHAGAAAQSAAPSSPIVQGSPDVSVGGAGAARQGDEGRRPGGRRFARRFHQRPPRRDGGARTGCGGAVVGGATNVFINGKPLARIGDAAAGCPQRQ